VGSIHGDQGNLGGFPGQVLGAASDLVVHFGWLSTFRERGAIMDKVTAGGASLGSMMAGGLTTCHGTRPAAWSGKTRLPVA